MTDTVEVTQEDRLIGERLRRLRRERQLSQADLGGDRFSGSYVSHVEKGRRRLSPELVQYFASRLGVSPEQITSDEPVVAGAGEVERVTAYHEIQRAHAEHRFAWAARTAEAAAREAATRGELADAWSLSMMRARALFEGDESEQAARLAMTLAGDPLAVSAPRLQVEALLLASRASRSASDLGLAVERGERALSLTGLVDDADLEAEARVVLLGALMEADQVERAEEVAEGLQRRLRRIGSPQVTGLAHWTLGNMAWLSGAAEEGARHHAEAARLLNPHVDLRNWGRFRKAAAVVRLQNGVVDDVLELLHQAGDALRIVGNPSDLTELRLAEARYWLLSGETRTARSLVEYSLDDTTLAEAPHSRAEAEQLLGEIEVAEGHQRAAGQAFLRAALLFEQAGAYKRSVQMWRRHAGVLA